MDGSATHTSRGTIEKSATPHAETTADERHRTRRSTLAIAAALVLAVFATLAAVVTGTAGPSGSRAGAATTSPEKLPAVQTVGFDVSATLTDGPKTTTLLTGNGAADLTNGDGTTTLNIPALSGLLGSNGAVTALWQGTNLYLQAPALSGLLGGKSWVEVSLGEFAGISSLGSTVQSYLSDPSKLSGLVTSLGGTVTDLGPQSNGTTEYQATIPVRGIVSDVQHMAHQRSSKGSKVKAASIKPFVKNLRHLGTSTITADAWVKNGQLTQVSVTADLSHATVAHSVPLPGGIAGGVVTVTVGLSYGVPVSVIVPPASEVDNLGNALPLLQSLGHIGSLSGLAARL
ncbi:MAG: hypothetical protein WB565_17205 [Acidimicrobiales bacterium]